ncbi:hypothetical protein H6F38_15600 [Paenibacillus sp. EKM208P]|uniref:hypothetical protein n=1 Tax=Paenibacillus polymyxa TaxID=1406 RepID=UPI0019F8574A|nr:hypothetical protein [Paenibacillus polymyxa]KAF6630836.1 hypothetical protein H6F38_15600 [Paenibacillus sp. EKM208P]WCM59089.1 hypothetical protein OYT09_13610 [Paenibacillus polymyxa]
MWAIEGISCIIILIIMYFVISSLAHSPLVQKLAARMLEDFNRDFDVDPWKENEKP